MPERTILEHARDLLALALRAEHGRPNSFGPAELP